MYGYGNRRRSYKRVPYRPFGFRRRKYNSYPRRRKY